MLAELNNFIDLLRASMIEGPRWLNVRFAEEKQNSFMLVVSVGGLFANSAMWTLWTCALTAKKPGKPRKTLTSSRIARARYDSAM